MVVLRTLLVCAVVLSCDGQLDFLFPGFRQILNGINDSPIVRGATQSSGETIAGALNSLANIPLGIARSIGIGYTPKLISSDNVVSLTDNFVADYNSGLGNEDARLNFEQLVTKYGYPLEKHFVETEDGYVLKMHRLPNNGTVVFLMHGLLGSSDDYICAGPEKGLAYLLHRDGYDVWLGNARGNKHSRKHREMKPQEGVFWDFSWHEIGCYDLPAMIDYTLEKTGKSTVRYIGHSQGTTTFFVMAAQRPEYNDKVALAITLSPVAFMSHIRSPFLRLLAPGQSLIHTFAKGIGIYEFAPDNSLMRLVKRLTCGLGALAEIVCSNALFLFSGFSFSQLNATNLPVVFGHAPSGASTKQFVHYAQEILSKKFRQFDYGPDGNIHEYGTDEPPDYPLKNIRAPVSMFYSDEDWMTGHDDVDELYQKLPNAVDIYPIPSKEFNHLDFLFANDFIPLIYNRVKKLLELYEDK